VNKSIGPIIAQVQTENYGLGGRQLTPEVVQSMAGQLGSTGWYAESVQQGIQVAQKWASMLPPRVTAVSAAPSSSAAGLNSALHSVVTAPSAVLAGLGIPHSYTTILLIVVAGYFLLSWIKRE
jgi:hypothetical protein